MQLRKLPVSRIFQTAVLCSCVTLAVGCSSDDDSSTADTSGTSTPTGSPGEQSVNPFAAALAGTWLAPCDPSSSGSSSQDEVSVNGTTMILTERNYTDAACTTPAVPAVLEFTLSLEFLDGTTNTPLGEATHTNATHESQLVDGQPPTAEQAAGFPSGTIYSILLIDNQNLHFGDDTDELDASSPEKRHGTLETAVEEVFVRQ